MKHEKAKSKSVSLMPELWEKIEEKATAHYGANRSHYIRDLIERDLKDSKANAAKINPETPIGDLIRKYTPLVTDRYEKAIENNPHDTREAEVLMNFLDQSLKLLTTEDRAEFAILHWHELRTIVTYAREIDSRDLNFYTLDQIHKAKRRDKIDPEQLITEANSAENLKLDNAKRTIMARVTDTQHKTKANQSFKKSNSL